MLNLPANPGESYDKMIDLFTPAIIEAQRDYARQLLTHVNAFRHVRYADDPAIAIVEISNEDSLFMWGAREHLKTLPPYYADLLQSQYSAWLIKKYGTTEKLRAAWSDGAEPLGDDLCRGGKIPAIGKDWMLQVQSGNTATAGADGGRRCVPHRHSNRR